MPPKVKNLETWPFYKEPLVFEASKEKVLFPPPVFSRQDLSSISTKNAIINWGLILGPQALKTQNNVSAAPELRVLHSGKSQGLPPSGGFLAGLISHSTKRTASPAVTPIAGSYLNGKLNGSHLSPRSWARTLFPGAPPRARCLLGRVHPTPYVLAVNSPFPNRCLVAGESSASEAAVLSPPPHPKTGPGQ